MIKILVHEGLEEDDFETISHIGFSYNEKDLYFSDSIVEYTIVGYIEIEDGKVIETNLKPEIEKQVVKLANEKMDLLMLAEDKPAKKTIKHDNDLISFFDRNAFIKHIQLLGSRGIGKSYGIEKYAKDNGYNFVKIALSEGKDETDIVGFSLRVSDGMAWLDGKVAEAFRQAANGVKTLLLLDELYRAPKRELSVLIDALTITTDGNYALQTNRITEVVDGIATVETIYAPRDMLWVCAASNIGREYDVDIADPAFQDRFRTKFLDNMKENEVKKIIDGYDIKQEYKDTIMSLWSACENAYTSKMLDSVLSIRHASELAYSVKHGKDIKECFLDLAPQLCARDLRGMVSEADIKTINEIVKGVL